MRSAVLEHQLRQLRLVATLAHVLPPLTVDLVASDGRVRRVATTPEAGPDLTPTDLRSAVERVRARPHADLLADLLELTPGSAIEVRLHVGCRHVHDLGGGLYLLSGPDRSRVVFVTLLDGPRARQVVAATERPEGPSGCAALSRLTRLGPVEVLHDQLTATTVVYCDHEHPAGLPLLEEYGRALFAACAVAELLDDVAP
jgi:hypothetical protein